MLNHHRTTPINNSSNNRRRRISHSYNFIIHRCNRDIHNTQQQQQQQQELYETNNKNEDTSSNNRSKLLLHLLPILLAVLLHTVGTITIIMNHSNMMMIVDAFTVTTYHYHHHHHQTTLHRSKNGRVSTISNIQMYPFLQTDTSSTTSSSRRYPGRRLPFYTPTSFVSLKSMSDSNSNNMNMDNDDINNNDNDTQNTNHDSNKNEPPVFYNDFEDYNSELFKTKTTFTSKSSTSSNENNDDDIDDDDDEDEDEASITTNLGDWRTFRRKLVASQNMKQKDTTSFNDGTNGTTTTTNNNKSENNNNDQPSQSSSSSSKSSTTTTSTTTKKSSTTTTTTTIQQKKKSPNEILFEQQNDKLANEYYQDIWAHEIATPEIGGLMIRMPLEVEIRRNYKHSMTGQKLRQRLQQRIIRDNMNQRYPTNTNNNDTTTTTITTKGKQISSSSSSSKQISGSNSNNNNNQSSASIVTVDTMEMAIWYSTAQSLVEEEMKVIAGVAESNGELDSSILTDDSNEVLQLYLDHQETWQEVCLVTAYDKDSATTLVLNRPLALQLTDSLGKLVLYGAFSGNKKSSSSSKDMDSKNDTVSLKDFIKAFGRECGIYVGGPDDQHLPATLIHGIAELDGAIEIAPGTGIYQGGLPAAVRGVLSGLYKPLEFRFFVGRHSYSTENTDELYDDDDDDDDEDIEDDDDDEILVSSTLDLEVVLGKYQPVACARSIALKQCIQLPKPLWHEVLELCGGELKDISEFEQLKRDDIPFQFVSEDDDDDDDDVDDDEEYEIVGLTDEDDLSELLDDDEDDDDEDDDEDDDDVSSEYYKI